MILIINNGDTTVKQVSTVGEGLQVLENLIYNTKISNHLEALAKGYSDEVDKLRADD